MATGLQIGGAIILTIGIGLISIPVAFIVAGLAAITFGIALERK